MGVGGRGCDLFDFIDLGNVQEVLHLLPNECDAMVKKWSINSLGSALLIYFSRDDCTFKTT